MQSVDAVIKEAGRRLCACLILAGFGAGGAHAQKPVDLAMLARIREEGLTRSQVAATFNHLTNVIGPRLTGSPAFKQAADWAEARLKSYGLAGVHQESWPFGRGWQLDQLTLELVEPYYLPLIGFAEAWSPSTKGELLAAPVYIGELADSTAVRARAAELRGAIVLATQPQLQFITQDRPEPSLTDQPVRIGAPPFLNPQGPLPNQTRARVMREVGAGLVLRPTQGQHGTMFVLGSRTTPDDAAPSVILAAEHYNLIVRALQAGAPVRLRARVNTRYLTADTSGYNVIAEIPGSDPALKDEIVLLGAHLDSWHAATGATDNADAAASLLEAMRILKALGATPRRTIRMALWGGEEEGLLGSRAYAARHYAGDSNAVARSKLAVYLNSDPGSGPIFGWYMEENPEAKAIFDAWLEPLQDLGVRRNVLAKIGSTDHLAFTALGLPGFNSLQDYVEYDTREHHTNMDFADRVKTEDLQQNAIVLASFAWQAAMRDAKIPASTHPVP
ncbi:MAG TPA: M20/M25/M40 family metallo-hydrolase [Gemmatimonadales bacterium]|nr:M20/M25/M40 family metallo-hydrolase [Gemmatimonadales bacterium]